jgi:pseudaminic acid synthase
VQAVRTAEAALGEIRYEPTAKEAATRIFRRSLFAARDIAAGEVFTVENIRSVRPGHGLHTRNLPAVLGTRAETAVPFGTPLAVAHLKPALREAIRP